MWKDIKCEQNRYHIAILHRFYIIDARIIGCLFIRSISKSMIFLINVCMFNIFARRVVVQEQFWFDTRHFTCFQTVTINININHDFDEVVRFSSEDRRYELSGFKFYWEDVSDEFVTWKRCTMLFPEKRTDKISEYGFMILDSVVHKIIIDQAM